MNIDLATLGPDRCLQLTRAVGPIIMEQAIRDTPKAELRPAVYSVVGYPITGAAARILGEDYKRKPPVPLHRVGYGGVLWAIKPDSLAAAKRITERHHPERQGPADLEPGGTANKPPATLVPYMHMVPQLIAQFVQAAEDFFHQAGAWAREDYSDGGWHSPVARSSRFQRITTDFTALAMHTRMEAAFAPLVYLGLDRASGGYLLETALRNEGMQLDRAAGQYAGRLEAAQGEREGDARLTAKFNP